MTDGAGVPSAAGVAAFESVAFSPFAVGAAATLAELEGDSLTSLGSEGDLAEGVSSLMESGSTISCSRREGTVKVISRPALPPDLRRASADLAVGGIATGCRCKTMSRRWVAGGGVVGVDA